MASSDSNGMFQHQQPSGNTNNRSPNNHCHHHHHYHDEEAGGSPGSAKVLSGDDVDLAKRNDIGESWRNFPQPLAGDGTKSKDDVGHEVDKFEANGNLDMGDGDKGDSKDEYYKQVQQQRALRTSAGSSSPEPVDRNHEIAYQMENIGSVEGQEASLSGHNGVSGDRSGSNESDQSTGSGGTDTNEGKSKPVGGDEHDEDDKDEGNDDNRPRDGDLESGTRRRVTNSSNMNLVAIFIAIAVQSTSALFAQSGTRWRVRNLSNMNLVAIFIAIAVQSTSAVFALSLDGISPLAQKLFTGVLVTNLVGFLCLYVALFPSQYITPSAANILGRVGAAAAAFGFLLMMGIKLSLWIIILACVVVLAASVLSFIR